MKSLDIHSFTKAAYDAYPLYKAENSWFHFEIEPTAHGIYSCWTAYQKTDAPSAGVLLLGDTKIRTDNDLVRNFGLSSANGVQEEETRRDMEELQRQRDAIAAGARAGSSAAAAARSASPSLPAMPMAGSGLVGGASSGTTPLPAGGAISVVGAGSILSTQGWSPMLNDAFVIGGVHAEHEFHLALSSEENSIFEALNSAVPPKDLWRDFFRRNPVSFWNTQYGVPRVFTRELLGLRAFGYKPEFSQHQLGFRADDKNKSDSASFDKYCEALRNAKMTPMGEKTTVIQHIAEFLFENKNALDA